MLRDGKFIKEELPKIGAFYIPKYKEEDQTPEERFVQSLILGQRNDEESFLSKFFGLMLRV